LRSRELQEQEMAEIRLVEVSKRFGETVAVDKANLTARDKEFLVLVGPSGCGKTTTLRMIAGLEELTEGEIFIGDRKVNDLAPKERDIAMVFQNYALYPHMSVYKNLGFGLKQRRESRSEIDRRVGDVAKMLGIEDLLKRKPKELSGGQRQRVAMGRAIVRSPKVFLFDEPLSNLDAKLRVQMRGELARLHEKLETTIIYVTHDQIEAMTLADRIVVMNNGLIMQVGAPMEVYRNPANLFVAGFIGSPTMNLLDVRISAENDSLYVMKDNLRLEIPGNLKQRFFKALKRDVLLGIRPEHIYDSRTKPHFPAAVSLRATVEVVEPIGSEIIIIASCGEFSFTARVDSENDINLHSDMDFLVDMNRAHLFDRTTQEAF
jgi:multiple sugar transport system ATP-binding protein